MTMIYVQRKWVFFLNERDTVNMKKAKYKAGDIVRIRPGISISKHRKMSDDSTFGVIKAIHEYGDLDFTPDYYIDLSFSCPESDYDDTYYKYFDERYIVGYADKFCKEEDICAEEISLLL